LDAGDGNHGRGDQCEAEPSEPVHGSTMSDRIPLPLFNRGRPLPAWTRPRGRRWPSAARKRPALSRRGSTNLRHQPVLKWTDKRPNPRLGCEHREARGRACIPARRSSDFSSLKRKPWKPC
jgi:hypothetical protein